MLLRSSSTLALSLALLLAPTLASAQQCAEGRVSTPETLGRCCWPGQSFSETLGRCTGAPSCPTPFVAEGDACVPPYTAGYGLPPGWAEAAPPPDAAAGTALPGAPRAALAWPEEPRVLRDAIVSPRLERGVDEGLLIAGLSTFLAGYLGGFVLGIADEAARNCESFDRFGGFGRVGCESWPYAFIPVVGGVLAGTLIERDDTCCRNASLGLGVGIPLALVQGLGLTLLGIGLFGGAEHLVPGERGGSTETVAVTPYFTGSEGGTWLRIEI